MIAREQQYKKIIINAWEKFFHDKSVSYNDRRAIRESIDVYYERYRMAGGAEELHTMLKEVDGFDNDDEE